VKRRVLLAACLFALCTGPAGAVVTDQGGQKRMRILVHIATGPDNPTRVALAFLVARTALDEGHSVSVFLAGDGVHLLRDSTLDAVTGLGTGSLREHYAAIAKGGGRFYLSGMSSKARNVSDTDLAGKPAEFASPNVLVRLAVEHDRVFTY
jgi:uncharacterized protein